MEDKNGLLLSVAADRRPWLGHTSAQEHLFYSRSGVHVDSARHMATVIFVIEPTVDNVKVANLVVERTVQNGVQLGNN